MHIVWPIIVDMCSGLVTDVIVKSVFSVQSFLQKKLKMSLSMPHLRAALIGMTGGLLAAELKKEISIVGHGGERVLRATLVKLLNKRSELRGKRIPTDGL